MKRIVSADGSPATELSEGLEPMKSERTFKIDLGFIEATFGILDPDMSDEDARALAHVALGKQMLKIIAREKRKMARKKPKTEVDGPNAWDKFIEAHPEALRRELSDIEKEWLKCAQEVGHTAASELHQFWVDYKKYTSAKEEN